MRLFKTNNNNAYHKTEKSYAAIGIALGLSFPVIGMIFDMWARSLRGMSSDIASVFFTNVPLTLSLAAPLIFGRIFMEIGKRQSQLEEKLDQINQTEKIMRHQAHHDALTGLYNRASLTGLMEEGIATGLWQQQSVSIFLLDLDNFKMINDTYGHHFGDIVLKETAIRLGSAVGEEDKVLRLGGDEFLIIRFPEQSTSDDLAFAHKLMSILMERIAIDDMGLCPNTSIGIARVGKDGKNWSDLLKSADIALYEAKKDALSSCRIFSTEMKHHSDNQIQLEMDMKNGLKAGEFELYYQPIFGAKTGKLRSFEALLRWNHPTRGLVMPSEFIPIAERSCFIIQLGQFALEEACKAAAGWPGPIGVSVNLSPVQFNDPSLLEHIEGALKASGLSTGRLDLEITESSMLEPSAMVTTRINALRSLGVRITMDDFGTGFSSLNSLRNFRFNRLKIDRSFSLGVPHIKQDMEIIRTILHLARTLKMETVIEGVETIEQLQFARGESADEVQGYYYSKPLPLANTKEYIDQMQQGKKQQTAA